MAHATVWYSSTPESLADALLDDAFYAFVCEPVAAPSRQAALTAYMQAALVEGQAVGRVVAEAHGAAIWSTGDSSEATAAAEASRREGIRAAVGQAGLQRFDAAVADMSAVSAALPELAGAWYLSILGVAPHVQRTGLGRRLLAPTLAEADTARAPCWLETYGHEALPFYASLGFHPVGGQPVRTSCVGAPYWILLRRPADRTLRTLTPVDLPGGDPSGGRLFVSDAVARGERWGDARKRYAK